MRRGGAALLVLLFPGAASAHDAFGDLGPFYTNLLHPFADPAQGLMLATAAVLLASQSPGTVRHAYAAFCAATAVAVVAAMALAPGPPSLRTAAIASALVCLVALSRRPLGTWPVALIAVVMAVAASLSLDAAAGARAASLGAAGGILGIAGSTLLAWGLVDEARRRIGPLAPSVAASWVAAVGLMAAVLPAV